MTPKPINGEPTRFQVQSRSNPRHTHIVDIAENFPLGACDCIHYTCTIWPAYRKLKEKPLVPKRCAHLVACREVALNASIQQHTSQ